MNTVVISIYPSMSSIFDKYYRHLCPINLSCLKGILGSISGGDMAFVTHYYYTVSLLVSVLSLASLHFPILLDLLSSQLLSSSFKSIPIKNIQIIVNNLTLNNERIDYLFHSRRHTIAVDIAAEFLVTMSLCICYQMDIYTLCHLNKDLVNLVYDI